MRALLVTFCLLASALPAVASERAMALLELVGYDVSAAAEEQMFRELPNKVGPDLSPDVSRDWQEAGEGLFQAEDLMETAARAVDTALTPDQIEALAIHYSSETALAITDLEKASQDPSTAKEVEAEQAAWVAGLDDSFRERFEIIFAMMDGMGVVETGTDLALSINFALMSGMAASDALPRSFSEAELLALVEMQRETVSVSVRNSVLESMAYAYRDLSDAELRAYSEFLQTPDARAFYAAIGQATAEVATRDARILGRRLQEMAAEREL
ncbi:hypothetical protein [Algicella marina]|uniref:DUF2059 domain-containing protein n=1 Tax=Algicella marina TaxID=2683284 RepID=A0A6P1SYQ8_9RHOB|nr:hypothetical protein [Algicella marina]QHQ34665.1 hypothetical protein GO499_05395 [Algicella marina]